MWSICYLERNGNLWLLYAPAPETAGLDRFTSCRIAFSTCSGSARWSHSLRQLFGAVCFWLTRTSTCRRMSMIFLAVNRFFPITMSPYLNFRWSLPNNYVGLVFGGQVTLFCKVDYAQGNHPCCTRKIAGYVAGGCILFDRGGTIPRLNWSSVRLQRLAFQELICPQTSANLRINTIWQHLRNLKISFSAWLIVSLMVWFIV